MSWEITNKLYVKYFYHCHFIFGKKFEWKFFEGEIWIAVPKHNLVFHWIRNECFETISHANLKKNDYESSYNMNLLLLWIFLRLSIFSLQLVKTGHFSEKIFCFESFHGFKPKVFTSKKDPTCSKKIYAKKWPTTSPWTAQSL